MLTRREIRGARGAKTKIFILLCGEAKIFFGSATFRRKFLLSRRSKAKIAYFRLGVFRRASSIFFALFRLALFAEIRRVSTSLFSPSKMSFCANFFTYFCKSKKAFKQK